MSYASQDAEAAHKICDGLRAGGIEVFFDQSELRGGDAWDRRIRQQIRDCALFMPVISARTQARAEGYFRLEWHLAEQRTHLIGRQRAFLVPVCIDDTTERDADVPDAFLAVQWTRLPQGQTSPAFVERVRRLLSPELSTTTRMPEAAGAAPTPNAPAIATRWSKRVLQLILALIVVALTYFLVDKVMISKHLAAALAPPPRLPIPSANSIAVLPFSDMSEKHDQEYFSDGMAEELIDHLTKVQGLYVPARTSSFYFKGKQATIAEIAQALGVAHVLEGSVRKSGNTLRITTQLIRADTGYHLWSETYDRDLTDIFRVQDEIASAVVAALHARLPIQTAQGDSGRPKNVEAYTQLLIGREGLRRGNEEGYRRAVEALRKAVELDPSYALAYAKLATAEDELAGTGLDANAAPRALAAAERAVALGPDLADAYMIRGSLLRDRRDWDGATRDLEKAVALDPRANNEYGVLLACLGRREEAIRAFQRATEVNPLAQTVWSNLGFHLTDLGRYDEARAALDRALQLAPEADAVHFNRGYLALRQLNAPEARAEFARVREEPYRLLGEILLQHSLGDRAASKRNLEEYVRRFGVDWAYQIAEAYAWQGDANNAFWWLGKALEQNDVGLSSLKDDDLLAGIRHDPRYTALLHRLNFPE